MLARSFKTAEELGITQKQHSALIQVLHMLERNELNFIPDLDVYDYSGGRRNIPKGNTFCMNYFGEKNLCGTVACIGGWMAINMGAKTENQINNIVADAEDYGDLCHLFYPKYIDSFTWKNWKNITPEQAARALSGYLQTGKVDWRSAIK